MKNTLQNYVLLWVYTLLFSGLIFLGIGIFFPWDSQEEVFIEPSISQNSPTLEQGSEFYSFSWVTQEQVDKALWDNIYEDYIQRYEQKQRQKLRIRYVPTVFQSDIALSYTPIAETFFYEADILSHIEDLGVYFYKNIADTRGRMKGWNIHMFGVEQMSDEEFLWVLIHEFAHYYDIHSMVRTSFGDQSQSFYDISWESVSIIWEWQSSKDFVSGYSMTNQYEDFAESYLYYVLHNKEFRTKAQSSLALAKKYDFFQTYVFQTNQFYNEDFWTSELTQDYYWDITKIAVDVKNFLQYLQDDI